MYFVLLPVPPPTIVVIALGTSTFMLGFKVISGYHCTHECKARSPGTQKCL